MNPSLFRRYTAPALLLTVLWLLAVHNNAYWRLLFDLSSAQGAWFTVSLVVFTAGLVTLLLSVLTFGRLTRYVLVTLICVSAAAAYFMDNMGVMIDRAMIENLFQTDRVEAFELLNTRLLLEFLLLGVLPAAVIWFLLPRRQPLGAMLREKAVVVGLSLVVIVVAVAPFYKDYASLVRNHREIHYLLTPLNTINGVYGYVTDLLETPGETVRIATDARKGPAWRGVSRPVVSVVVIGETARADSFSLYGYERETNPALAGIDLIRFDNVAACGTSTAVSLPCMFSDLGRDDFDRSTVRGREGLLDALKHAGLRTVWLDNNSGCKGACRSAQVWSPAGLDIDGVCENGECLDAVLLGRLEKELATAQDSTVIVVHMNGSHGPSYYRRYPDEFRVFTPDCRSDELSECTQDEIRNSYDNSIRYTDWFLAEVIDRLEGASTLDTALLYVSDHGESLGEFGLYLHGTPYFVAPEQQIQVPMFLWLSSAFEQAFGIDRRCLQQRVAEPLSHDNLFHSVLGMLDIETRTRREDLDLFDGCTEATSNTRHAADSTPAEPTSEYRAARPGRPYGP